jgi:alkanesulfonate monooxygenase SsuD/methylene tetrahydromethanopterin reductase-like flavin-dependent oxidoreductase (luciferase family)
MDEHIAAMRAVWGPDPVAYDGRFYQIPPSELNPKPVQAHLPVLFGAMSAGGIRRAARVADGLNPIAFSAEALLGSVKAFHAAAEEIGRDPATLRVVVRANVPITAEPLGDDRPYLGGSPRQIAEDVAALEGTGVDHVLFSNTADVDADEEVRLLERLITEVNPG